MRKLAYCHDCKKKRKIVVHIWATKIFDPLNGWSYYDDIELDGVFCESCFGDNLELTEEEKNQLFNEAIKS